MAAQVRVLQLEAHQNLETKLYRLEKGWKLRFTLGPTLQPYSVRLFCNHPPDGKKSFDRRKYYELSWSCPLGKQCDDADRLADLTTCLAGSFHFYITFKDEGEKEEKTSTSGYFTVDPVLYVNSTETIPLDCVSLQTVLSKSLGPLSEWYDRLRVTKETGYNMIHFTPIQQLGKSNSSYSLSDQLSINAAHHSPGGKKATFDGVKELLDKIRTEWKVISVVDIVLNHTCNQSPWLWQHPECAYNLENSPHLRPAFLLDRALWHLSCQVADGLWESEGLPAKVNNEGHIQCFGHILRNKILPELRLWEFFCVNVEKTVEQFRLALLKAKRPQSTTSKPDSAPLEVITAESYQRLSATIDMEKALKKFNRERSDALDEKDRLHRCCEALREHLQSLNEAIKNNEVAHHIDAAINNVQNGARYERLDGNGPKHPKVTRDFPLATCYFITSGDCDTLEDEEKLMFSDKARFCMAHQGWIFGGDPLRDFAAPGSLVYLRRELIAWGDSVKLRYGKGPDDAPFLWNHMLKYTQICSRLFDGIRLDNCHSTPLHVAEYFVDAARQVKPELYVTAELFTGSEATDNIFVNQLGITSLIREALNAHDPHEEGRLIYRYGGEPVGAFMHPSDVKPLVPSIAHALFMDVTHDNPSPFQVRSVYDAIASSALVSMACCATGSSRGYDELVPHHIHVVKEDRLYQSWPSKESRLKKNAFVRESDGILSAKRAINELHRWLGDQGYTQVYVDQIHHDVHAITRHNPDKRKTVVLVAYSAFHDPSEDVKPTVERQKIHMTSIPPLTIPGEIEEIIFEAMLLKRTGTSEFCKDEEYINGLQTHEVLLQRHIPFHQSKTCRAERKGDNTFEVHFHNFAPGSVVAFDITMENRVKDSLGQLRQLAVDMYKKRSGSQDSSNKIDELHSIIENLSLCDLNRVLYRADPEERDDGNGGGVYVLPETGSLVYCGLQGVISVLANVRQFNDLGHPLCRNLRDGDWLMDYTVSRLLPFVGTRQLGVWLDKAFNLVKGLPRYLVPCYFDAIVTPLYLKLLERAWAHMSSTVRNGSSFLKALSLGSLQFVGLSASASLPVLSPNLHHGASSGASMPTLMSLAAGLPHFSTGFMRCWGRDTFIALRGLLLVTGRYQDARRHILAYGACVRHGLIPNLLDGGRKPRYNCRDATWWWLQCIQDYCSIVPDGLKILSDPVSRIFPSDSSQPEAPGKHDQPLYEVIQEVMQRHFIGISFRERGAGPDLDSHMTSAGFNVTAGVREKTGFVFGGNKWNAGTWMDKVGESHKAGNFGVPATPRDGSAVELVGLCKSTVRWLAALCKQKQFRYAGVSKLQDGFSVELTYEEWASRIDKAFEENFWIPEEPTFEDEENKLVHRRGIYKDSVGATHRFADYQLRPNLCVAMAVAPEMFIPEHAWKALDAVENILLGPLGLATLDSSDWAYEGVYDNSQDSSSYKSAKGFCYHQGPEWLWCLGPFLRARLYFSKKLHGRQGLEQTVVRVKEIIAKHKMEIASSPWHSLPELTNAKGSPCYDGCPAQAWSVACLIEVLYDMEQLLKTD